MSYDAVIIGGGLSGLYCGALLSRKRMKAVILEQHLTVGGLAAGFTRKGYYFDSCMARFVADNNRGYFDELGLLEKQKFVPHQALLNIEGKTYTPRNGYEFFESCADAFPAQEKGLMAFYHDYVKALACFMEINALSSPMSYSGAKQLRNSFVLLKDLVRKGCLKGPSLLMKGFDIPLHQVLPKYIDTNSNLYSLLTGSKYLDLFYKGGDISLMTFVGSVCSNYGLNRYPYNGFQSMCDDVAEFFANNGGEIITGARVTKIVVENGKAVGAEYMKGGKTVRLSAKNVINASDLKKAYFNLLDESFSAPETLQKIGLQQSTAPIPIMYVGLKMDRSRLRELFGGAAEVNFYPDLNNDMEHMDGSCFYKHAPMIIHSSCLTNPAHAPEGCSNLQIYLTCPPAGWMDDWGVKAGKRTDRYHGIKSMVVGQVLENLEAVIPEISDRSIVEVCELGTPFTIERYTGNTGGAHCGFTWDKALNKVNTGLGKFHYKHENVENLYFIGHWTGYMGGVTNALWSARHLARRL